MHNVSKIQRQIERSERRAEHYAELFHMQERNHGQKMKEMEDKLEEKTKENEKLQEENDRLKVELEKEKMKRSKQERADDDWEVLK
ncbi:hypothetical protein CRE_08003 [Caenorhabditis remanei]|uniref:Uncharacterized protein n=1 Tax=Caenorhabditis remanei TaxID=31234 RepID=E3M3Q7_CAERE|nr:hypothetical protein CRE_08003 [Caenorhabditis remanei]